MKITFNKEIAQFLGLKIRNDPQCPCQSMSMSMPMSVRPSPYNAPNRNGYELAVKAKSCALEK